LVFDVTDAPTHYLEHMKAMSASEGSAQPASGATHIFLVTGDRHRVDGDVRDVERAILDAARGSIMQFAWLVDADTREDLAVNPEHVVALRAARPE
jgi:hypothetical protein